MSLLTGVHFLVFISFSARRCMLPVRHAAYGNGTSAEKICTLSLLGGRRQGNMRLALTPSVWTTQIHASPIDSCLTSLFNCTWFCSCCGREFCSECQAKLVEIHANPNLQTSKKPRESNRGPRRLGDHSILLRCSNKREHAPEDFLPVSRFRRVQLSSIVEEMTQLSKTPSHFLGPDAVSQEVESISFKQHEHNGSGTRLIPSHNTVSVPSMTLTDEYFARLWREHRPIVVDEIALPNKTIWSPQFTIENYGDQQCPIENCQTGEQRLSSVKEFFEMYGKGLKEPWKLKVITP